MAGLQGLVRQLLQRDAETEIAHTVAATIVEAVGLVAPFAVFNKVALAFGAVAGGDVDNAGEGVGTKGGGIGAAHHLNTLNIIDANGQVAPTDPAVEGAVDRTAIDQYLHAA